MGTGVHVQACLARVYMHASMHSSEHTRLHLHLRRTECAHCTEPDVSCGCTQCIKDWYKRLPDELGALLEKNKGRVFSAEERSKLELEAENKFLRDEGWNEDQIRKLRSYTNNPVVEGAVSKWSKMEPA